MFHTAPRRKTEVTEDISRRPVSEFAYLGYHTIWSKRPNNSEAVENGQVEVEVTGVVAELFQNPTLGCQNVDQMWLSPSESIAIGRAARSASDALRKAASTRLRRTATVSALATSIRQSDGAAFDDGFQYGPRRLGALVLEMPG